MPESMTSPLGIFGGTFDPIHYAHLRVAEEALDALQLAQVLWVPAGQPALRAAPRVSAEERLAMVALAIADNSRFLLDSAEVEAKQVSYTVTTLKRLRQVHGAQRPLVLLLGADTFAQLENWQQWQNLIELAHIAVAHRPGFVVDAAHYTPALARLYEAHSCHDPTELKRIPHGRILNFASHALDISATRIRHLLAVGHSARYLLPAKVLHFIQTHRFYHSETHEN